MLNSQKETSAKKNQEAKAEHKEEMLKQSNFDRDDLHEAGIISEQQRQIVLALQSKVIKFIIIQELRKILDEKTLNADILVYLEKYATSNMCV